VTATATDRLTVSALTREDAKDIARRQWETFGFRVLRIVEVVAHRDCVIPVGDVNRWIVIADVELRR
jgi:hypothetical protein